MLFDVVRDQSSSLQNRYLYSPGLRYEIPGLLYLYSPGLLRMKYQVCLFYPEQFLLICFHFGSEELSTTSKVKFSIFVLDMHNHFRYLN